MRDLTVTEAIDVVGRGEAEHELPGPLRADVRMLGGLLGRVLRESGSEGLFDDVERLRHATIAAYTDDSPQAFARAEEIADSFDVQRADEVARAFTAYFHLVNLAEEHQRVRVLRERDGRPEARDAKDSVASAYARLTGEIGAEAATERLQQLRFHPVFTAHPTEARRRAVSMSIRRLAALLIEHDRAAHDAAQRDGADDAAPEQVRGDADGAERLSSEQRRLQRLMLQEIDTLWRTAPLRAEKPTPVDEVRAVMAIFDDTLYMTIPQVYRRVDDVLQGGDAGARAPLVKPFVRVGTWVGGDRDGNPFVTASVTKKAAAIASEHILLGLEHTAERVARSLTLSGDSTPPSTALLALWQRLSDADEDAAVEVAKRAPDEPHKRVLMLLTRRLAATRARNADLAYADPDPFLADLRTVQDSLVAAGAPRQAYGELQHLIWQVETFGFHLAELEVRQHSAVHAKVLAECEAGEPLSPLAEEVLEVFRTIAQLQRRYGPRAAGRYIVSFTQSAADLAAVHRLARFAVGEQGTPPVLDVIPLFETFADLQAAPAIMAEIIEHPAFAERLAATGRRLEVMLGYSDSSKDVGPVAANLALYEAQALIAEWARENGIQLTLFHGRGGALGRGGGPANSAVLAQPPHSVEGRFKLTEQGEVIFARYGDPDIAMRHIDQVAAAVLLASAPSYAALNREAAERFADVAATMDAASRAKFFELVKAPGFAPWFATVTPMEEIGLLALGSRPARRGLSVESLADLRAIPWVFAWSQARINLAGWFGLGTALEAVGDEELLRGAYDEWPLLRTIIDNIGMSLAKSDVRIARRYLDLGDRDDLAALVLDELELTQRWVVRIVGGDDLLANKPVLQRAVKMRDPYVDALSLLQLRALRALRTASDDQDVTPWQHLLLLSVSGVAAGLQNTG
ncbi:phosphoenolpyruvate carboxylase [Microbacterium sp. No. 7]|uniref:phosphoenolpyruvate carboxylase n=1 Tax=Microbacterium sp. No. 7 TaxID=1714373 RepID=UPI0006CF6C9C|nr:phosphoenolpyruvate carboxylase [Microbacterium sp. No. 7]ALJ19828.1 phosphoenolpyruvate carboxylase [Microbacterium sp. No. 7]